jgi:predicted RNA-binding protein with PIN domain
MGEIKGRPKKAVRQEKFVGYFVTKLQYYVIQQKAEEAGVSISDYMRQVAVYGQVKAKWTAEERGMVKKLIGISGDIHQLLERAQKDGANQAALIFASYRDILDEIIKQLCHDR